MRWVEHVVCMRKMRNAYKILVGRPEGKAPLERHRYRWEYNIKVYLRKMRFEFLDQIHLAEDSVQW
jgi:hypothetical protein